MNPAAADVRTELSGGFGGAPPRTGLRRQLTAGFTLSELLISMVLGLFLVGGVLGVFLSGMETQRLNSATARMQESARFAMEVLRRDIRQAGFFGCGSSATVNNPLAGMGITNTLDSSDFEYAFDEPIRGFRSPAVGGSEWSPALLGEGSMIIDPLLPTLANQSNDVLTVVRIDDVNAEVEMIPGTPTTGAASPSVNIKVSDTDAFAQFDVVMITDCTNAAIFQITNPIMGSAGFVNINHNTGNVAEGPGNLTEDLGHNYESGQLVLLEKVAYYLAPSTIAGRTSLYRNDEEIAIDVESLRFEYGVAAVGDPMRAVADWVPADAVVDVASGRDWDDVMAVRATLVFSSGADDNLSETANVNGVGTDRRAYQTYTTTVGIRNRLVVAENP
jgi:type IV pilus assembly protein PilW